MGTAFRVAVALDGPVPDPAARLVIEEAVNRAFQEVDRIERLMSEWRPDSEISAVNGAAGQQPVVISQETFDLLTQAVELSARTNGAFDVTWAALRGQWDFKAQPPKLPDAEALDDALRRTGWRKLKLDAATRTAFLTQRGMAIGLGGIAKGHAIDRAADVLRRAGLRRFIVDGGGDIYVAGEKANGVPWRLGVQDPRDPKQLIGALEVRDAALVTSGDYERYFEVGGRRYHHIIDLKTGYPAERSRAVTVRARNATLADALATALFVLGPKRGIAVANSMEGVEAAIVGPDGRLHTTEGLRQAFEPAPAP